MKQSDEDYPIADTAALAEGWAAATIGDIAYFVRRGKQPKYASHSGLPVINQRCIRWGYLDPQHLRFVDPSQWSKWPEETFLQDGDLLLNSTGTGTIGRATVFRGLADHNRVVFDAHVTVIRVSPDYLPELLQLWFRHQPVQRWLESAYTGSTNQVELPKSLVLQTPVPVPPLAEQHRVVGRATQLLSRISDLSVRLERVKSILEALRPTIYAAASSGRLSAKYRGDTVQVPPRLKALPAGWSRRRVGDLCKRLQYGTSKKSEPTGRVPVLRMGNLQNGEIDWSDLLYTTDERDIERYRLEPNTVLFNRTNSPELVGKTAIYRGERPAIFAGYLIRMEEGGELEPEYLNICLNAPDFRQYCASVKTDGVSQSNINAKKLADYRLPWCAPGEQKEIVRRTGELIGSLDMAIERVTSSLASVPRLRQSILASAFRGNLVPTEADLADNEHRDYEPGAALLKRIQHALPLGQARRSRRRKAPVSSKKSRRPLATLAAEIDGPISPEQLFSRAGFTAAEVDDFYEELRAAISAGHYREVRPNRREVFLKGR